MTHRDKTVCLCAVVLAVVAWERPMSTVDAGERQPGHPVERYGRELPVLRDLGVGPTMAARVVGDRLYTIGRGTLRVADIADPGRPRVIGRLTGLGNTRQIQVSQGIAYITARETGLFIVDVRDDERPKLLCHYDPIEVATGVDVSGHVLFIACRHHGLETVDVTDPAKPVHLGIARTGEAQSVAVRNGYAYVGVWGSSELAVVDVRNPRDPTITSRCRLDGYGDGVALRGRYAFVATGHHSRERRTYPVKPDDPGYGLGHGLEIFDLRDPAKPVFVSRLKLPKFYRIGMDMWGVKVAGDHAFVHDTYNGVFVVNVSDPSRPLYVAQRQLPYHGQWPGVVGGLALARDHIYVAGAWSDLHVVAAPGIAQPMEPEPDTPPEVPTFRPRRHKCFCIYRPGGQVRAAASVGEFVVAAAGTGGLHVLRLGQEVEVLGRYPTRGFAMDVAAHGKHVFAAEDKGGLSIWRMDDSGALERLSVYQPKGRVVREVMVPPRGRYALVQVMLSRLDVLDVSDPTKPVKIFTDGRHGFLYHMGEQLIDERCLCITWQIHGVFWYDLYSGAAPVFTGHKWPHRIGGSGTVVVDGQVLAVAGQLLPIQPGETRSPREIKGYGLRGKRLRGKPRLVGSTLYLCERHTGSITALDVSDHRQPKLIESLNVPGNPGRVIVHQGRLVVPNGYEGLWVAREPE